MKQPFNWWITLGLIFVLLILITLVCMVSGSSGAGAGTEIEPSSEYLQRYAISDTEAVCNDGTEGAYYYMTSPTDRNTWVLYLSGSDLWCFSDESCDAKIVEHGPVHMGSEVGYEDQIQPYGFQVFDSNLEDVNPSFWDAHHVEFVYCSSDSWMGTAPLGTTSDKYAFMGDPMLRSAVTDLMDKWQLAEAEDIMIVSSVAGGMSAIDTITTLITARCEEEGWAVPKIKCVTDSPWYVINEPFNVPEDQCTMAENCPIDIAMPLAYDYWQAVVGPDCLAAGYTWECILASYAAPYTQTPLMIGMYESDAIQMQMDGAGFDDVNTTEGEAYFTEDRDNVYATLEESLQEGSIYFVAGCVFHGIYFSTQGLYELDGVTLNDAVIDWFYDVDTTTNRADYCTETNCNTQCDDNDEHL